MAGLLPSDHEAQGQPRRHFGLPAAEPIGAAAHPVPPPKMGLSPDADPGLEKRPKPAGPPPD